MTALACTICGTTGPQVALVFDLGGDPGKAMCSTVSEEAANQCAERARENDITEE